MRRIVVLTVALLVSVAIAVTVTLLLRPSGGASARPAKPLRGHTAASADARALARPLDRFGLALLSREAAATSGNVVISPLSIHDVLSMIYNGAEGETAAEMRRVLGLGDVSKDVVNQGWADLITGTQVGRKPAIQIANSLWLRDGVPFRASFLNVNRDFFAADPRALPADPGKAAAAINGWVKQRTAGLIKQIVSPDYFTDRTILALVNTVHVKAAWTYFDSSQTHPGPFTLADGQKVQVPMMNAPVTAPVVSTRAYDAIGLQTKAPVTVWIVVPKGAQTPEQLVGLLQRRGLDALYRRAKQAAALLYLPRFKTEFSAPDLKPELEALGMRRAFSPDLAELQGIVDPGTMGRVYIERVVHKAVLDVNEGGVEAAAATVGLVGLTSVPAAPMTIRADRPFLMLLTEKGTSAPLFMALIRDPRA